MLGTFNEEWEKIQNRYESRCDATKINELKERLLTKPIILFGLGFFGTTIYKNFVAHGIVPKYFCDSNKSGVEKETSIEIISPALLRQEYSNANVVISVANPRNQESITQQLLTLGFDKEQIFTFDTAFKFLDKSIVEITSLSFDKLCQQFLDGYRWSYDFFTDDTSKKVILERINSYLFKDILDYEQEKPAYFPREMITISETEVFVDGGLYTGDTSEEFIKQTGGKYRSIHGFDIDETNLCVAKKNLSKYENVTVVPKGLWSETAVLNASLQLTAGSNISEVGTVQIPVVSLDEYFSNKSVEELPTFIKMDIEGSERNALLGSAKIIEKVRPKLAICAYHKPEDIYDLPQTILNIRKDYKFALRHYSPYTWETVLYAY